MRLGVGAALWRGCGFLGRTLVGSFGNASRRSLVMKRKGGCDNASSCMRAFTNMTASLGWSTMSSPPMPSLDDQVGGTILHQVLAPDEHELMRRSWPCW